MYSLNRLSYFVTFSKGSWFSVCKIVWPKALVFLCLWHIRRALAKVVMCKDKVAQNPCHLLHEIGSIMCDQEGPWRADVEKWAIQKIMDLTLKYLLTKEFW